MPQFKLTRRQVLIDRLFHDPQGAGRERASAARRRLPRDVAMRSGCDRYAREIVPAFNAYLYFRVGYWLAKRSRTLLYRVRLGYTDEPGAGGGQPEVDAWCSS